jgi:RPA family protein
MEEQNQNSLLELIGYKRQYGTPNNGNILLSLKPELIQIILNKIATYTDITLRIKEVDDNGNILYLNNKINSK